LGRKHAVLADFEAVGGEDAALGEELDSAGRLEVFLLEGFSSQGR
jgi:hypothetical protein